MYWLVLYDFVDDYLERRKPLREAHLALIRDAHARGEVVMAGAFDPPEGGALVFKTDDRAAIERFVQNDPYVQNGLVTRWRIYGWTVVIGGETGATAAAPTG